MAIAIFMLIAVPVVLMLSMHTQQQSRVFVTGSSSNRTPGEFERRLGQLIQHEPAWRELGEAETSQHFSGSSVVSMLRHSGLGWYQSRLFGSIQINIDVAKLEIFDWWFSRRRPKGYFQTGFQTVVIATPTVDLNIPHFFLRPRMPASVMIGGVLIQADGTNDGLSCYPTVKLETMVTGNLMLESNIEYRARMLFDTPFARETLGTFINERNWTVEWTGEQLVVYQRDKLVSPTDFKHFADDLIQLIEMLPASEAAVNESFQHLVKASMPS